MHISPITLRYIVKEEIQSILVEGKFERETTNIVRIIFRDLKNAIFNDKMIQDKYGIPRFKKVYTDKEQFAGLDAFELEVSKYNTQGEPYEVSGLFNVEEFRKTGRKTITISVDIEEFFNEEDFSDLHAELKDTVRHELEHTTQQWKKEEDPVDILSYFSSKNEVEAYVSGLYKKAKVQKRPFIEVLDEFIHKVETMPAFADLPEKNKQSVILVFSKIKDKMLNYAKERFPAAQL